MMMPKLICAMCGRDLESRQQNDVIGDSIRCRMIYRCNRCKRDLVYEECYR